MQSSLLRTKLRSPPRARHLVSRARLIDALERGLPASRLVLVLAPAGYGKTTLLAEWATRSNLPVAWLTMDPDDNDLERFLRYLFAAWETCQPEITNAPPGVLLSGMMPDTSAVLAELVNHASDSAAEMALVIDDCHLIENPDISGALAYLLDYLPPTIHLVLAGRGDPSLPLARYRARQAVLDIGAAELQFTVAESRTMLNATMGLDIPDSEIDLLTKRLEGWVAGLQLASLTLRRRGEAMPDLAITGRHRFIADFLRDEVLASLPTETRRFLLQTCIVDRLCGPLADAITGMGNGQTGLERLEREHLFTMPLDDNREWFRYHRFLLDYLREEIRREPFDEVAELHRRAATWYLHEDMPEPAFDHALAANDMRLVVEVVDTFVQVKMFSGQVTILLQWLRAIPDEWFTIEPLLILFRSTVNVVTGQFDACVRCLDDVEQAIRSTEREMPDVMARVTAMRCFVACFRNDLAQAESFAEVALDTLVVGDERYRYGVYGALGDTYRRNGYWTQAQEHYRLALGYADNPEGYIQSVHAFGALADLALRQGKLREAVGYWRKALARIGDQQLWGAYPLPLIGWVHVRLGEMLYEQNDLEAALDFANSGRERAKLGGDPRAQIAGGLLGIRLHLARGEVTEADALNEQIQPIVAEVQFPEWSSEFERCRVELWLAQGKLRSAVAWSDEALARDLAELPDQEPALLAAARVLVVKGDASSIEHALTVLQPIADMANASGRIGLQIAALAPLAMGLWARGDRAGALSTFEQALRLAEPEGYARTFIDLGLPMARILQETRARNVMPDYVDALLSGFGQVSVHGHMTERLPEPLSEREIEVLRNIAAGLTNREIAEALFISPETVKKHTGSIYGKLGVRSRMEAVALSRKLGLLD